MDPGLQYISATRGPADEIRAIGRLAGADTDISDCRIVTRFDDIVTLRARVGDIAKVRSQFRSLKCARSIGEDGLASEEIAGDGWRRDDTAAADVAFRRRGLKETGRGVVLGMIDFGFDFANPCFVNAQGSRIAALWAQGHPDTDDNRYGYGRVFARTDLTRALDEADPYVALGYHWEDKDLQKLGAHGTHCLSIAAGNGRSGAPLGVAPDADLCCVELAHATVSGEVNLGDTASIVEALDFISRAAGDRAVVCSLSAGAHAGPHDCTLVELAIERWLQARAGRAFVHSCGNYQQNRTHASGFVSPGNDVRLSLVTPDDSSRNHHEVEIWYPGSAEFSFALLDRHGSPILSIDLNKHAIVELPDGGKLYGFHRQRDPNNGDHNINAFFDGVRGGDLDVLLRSRRNTAGEFHAWIEKSTKGPATQMRFAEESSDPYFTTGSICHAPSAITVGAYNDLREGWPVASFSSWGPTRDHRQKPDCLAPGVAIPGARSAARRRRSPASDATTIKSGTSMAAPFVAGTVACMFEAARSWLPIETTRRYVLSTADPLPSIDRARGGFGYVNAARAVSAARSHPHVGYPAPQDPTRIYFAFDHRTDEKTPSPDTPRDASRIDLAMQKTPPSYSSNGFGAMLESVDRMMSQTPHTDGGDILHEVLKKECGLVEIPNELEPANGASTAAALSEKCVGIWGTSDGVIRHKGVDLKVSLCPMQRLTPSEISAGSILISRSPTGRTTRASFIAGPPLRASRARREGYTLAEDYFDADWVVPYVEPGHSPVYRADRRCCKIAHGNSTANLQQWILKPVKMRDRRSLPRTGDVSASTFIAESASDRSLWAWIQHLCIVVFEANIAKDGMFGPNTKAALQEAQRQLGIDADGIFGPITKQHFTACYMRRELADALDTFFVIDGTVDEDLSKMVADFEEKVVLPITGNPAEFCWRLILRFVQRFLNDMYDQDIPLDAQYGQKTHDLVSRFQREHLLKVDGVAGPRTVAMIRDELGYPPLGSAAAEITLPPPPFDCKNALEGSASSSRPSSRPTSAPKPKPSRPTPDKPSPIPDVSEADFDRLLNLIKDEQELILEGTRTALLTFQTYIMADPNKAFVWDNFLKDITIEVAGIILDEILADADVFSRIGGKTAFAISTTAYEKLKDQEGKRGRADAQQQVIEQLKWWAAQRRALNGQFFEKRAELIQEFQNLAASEREKLKQEIMDIHEAQLEGGDIITRAMRKIIETFSKGSFFTIDVYFLFEKGGTLADLDAGTPQEMFKPDIGKWWTLESDQVGDDVSASAADAATNFRLRPYRMDVNKKIRVTIDDNDDYAERTTVVFGIDGPGQKLNPGIIESSNPEVSRETYLNIWDEFSSDLKNISVTKA